MNNDAKFEGVSPVTPKNKKIPLDRVTQEEKHAISKMKNESPCLETWDELMASGVIEGRNFDVDDFDILLDL